MTIDIEKLNRTRRRANRSLRVFQVIWIPLILVYAAWLIALGYEAAKVFHTALEVRGDKLH